MKIVSMLMLVGSLACSSVNAGGLIFGGNFGIATGGEDAESYNEQLAELGLNISDGNRATTSGDIRTTWQVFVAYQFLPRWGVELAYVDLGESTVDFSDIDNPGQDIIDKVKEADLYPRSAQGLKLSVSYRFELNNSLQLQSKLGMYTWATDYSLTADDSPNGDVTVISNSGTDVSLGLGLVHKLTNEISAHLDWDFYTIDGEVINTFMFGTSYIFE